MRHIDSSNPIKTSILLSILLHLSVFMYLYVSPSPTKEKRVPISVEYMSTQKNEASQERPSFKDSENRPVPKLKEGSPTSSVATVPKSSPAVKPENVKAADVSHDEEAPEAHPVETAKGPALPGKEELIPALDKLTKTETEKNMTGEGAEGKDEETVSLDSTDFKYTSYLHGVKFKIEGVWRYPDAAKKSALQGQGLVSFTIHRDGTLNDLKLLSSSGYPILDEAILKAIRDAAPFNPMTENMRVKRLNVVATFEYNLVVQRIWGR